MEKKKQNSIDWLENEINRRGPKENNPPQWLKKLYEQAKAMHKEEIEEAYGHGQNNGYMYAHQKAITISKENYFNQTFGGQDNE